jgi:hypothetical protein
MTVSAKQLEANRKNAQKGGVKTPEGKAIVKYNALKHGLLTKEAVIKVGDGAENPKEFHALLADLKAQLLPEGTLEEVLVEKIAVSLWRLRRAYRCEAGLIRDKLDEATGNFYSRPNWSDQKQNKTDAEIEKEIAELNEYIQVCERNREGLMKLRKEGKSPDSIYHWKDHWDFLLDRILDSHKLAVKTNMTPPQMHEFLKNNAKWDDERIYQELMNICDDFVTKCREKIQFLKKEKSENRMRIEVIKKMGQTT